MFGTETLPFFFFSGNIIFVMSAGIRAPIQGNSGKLQEGKPRLVKIRVHFNMSMQRMFLIVVLENTLESPLDCKEIKPVHPKGNQS